MGGLTLFEKLWRRHVIREEAGHALLYIDRLLVYEVTSPQAFEGLRLAFGQSAASGAVDLRVTPGRYGTTLAIVVHDGPVAT